MIPTVPSAKDVLSIELLCPFWLVELDPKLLQPLGVINVNSRTNKRPAGVVDFDAVVGRFLHPFNSYLLANR